MVVTIRPAKFGAYVLSFDKACFLQALIKSWQCAGHRIRKPHQEADYVSPLLPACCGDPRRDAAEKRDEIATPHLITSSAKDMRGCYHPSRLAERVKLLKRGERPI
jgi:hypothetical protein